MTMDEFGAAPGFKGKSMSVRIAQYETGARVPKQDMLLKIAEVLQCNYKALDDNSHGAAEDIIETLFWLEENLSSTSDGEGRGKHLPEYITHGNLIRLNEMIPVSNDADVKMTYNDNEYMASSAPVSLTFDYGLINDFLLEWNTKKKELVDGTISANDYFEWKITYPHGGSK